MFFVNFGHPKDAWPQLRGFWGWSRRPGLMDAAFSNRRAKVPNRRINYLFEPFRGRRFLRTAALVDQLRRQPTLTKLRDSIFVCQGRFVRNFGDSVVGKNAAQHRHVCPRLVSGAPQQVAGNAINASSPGVCSPLAWRVTR
jgi:hypothetical protein